MRIGNFKKQAMQKSKQTQRGDPNDPGVKQTRRISNSAEYFVEYLDQHPMLIFVLENKEEIHNISGLVEPLLSSQSGRPWNIHYNVA